MRARIVFAISVAIVQLACASGLLAGEPLADADVDVIVFDDAPPARSHTDADVDSQIVLAQATLEATQSLDTGPSPSPASQTVSNVLAEPIGEAYFQPLDDAANSSTPSVQYATVTPGSSVLSIPAANVIAAPETGSLLRESASSNTISLQRRNPVSFDPHVRGYRWDQILARTNGVWSPVRPDLDSMISKFDPSLIEDVVVLPGPYGLRFGPAFSYIDVSTVPTPRSVCGIESHAEAGASFRGNGGRLYGRATATVAGPDWGFRGHYGSRTGSDYESGDGTEIPSSYDSQTFLGEYGMDLTSHSRFEVRYDRLDLNDTEYALQFFDVNYLGTDSCAVRYIDIEPGYAPISEVLLEGWYNRTRYNGNNANASKTPVTQRVVNALVAGGGDPAIDKFLGTTSGHRMITGGRGVLTLGETDWIHARVGADIRYEDQQINEHFAFFDTDAAPDTEIFPINTQLPTSWYLDTGVFGELVVPVLPSMDSTVGLRVDFYDADARISDIPAANNSLKGPFPQTETLCSFYWLNDLQVTDAWSSQFGFGYGQRAPSLIDRYSNQVFLGILQSGFSKVIGSPNLAKERLWQMDLGVRAEYDYFRGKASIYQAWALDYVTYSGNLITSPEGARQLFATNTDLVTLAGCELYGEYDASDYITLFSGLQYVQGTDQQIDAPLWGIAPLDGRAGIRLHDGDGGGLWGVELGARMVDRQNRAGFIRNVADPSVLIPIEQITPGFATADLRSYYNYSQNVSFVAGFENLLDKNYLEHLDLRLPAQGGLPAQFAYAPGFSFYAGIEVVR